MWDEPLQTKCAPLGLHKWSVLTEKKEHFSVTCPFKAKCAKAENFMIKVCSLYTRGEHSDVFSFLVLKHCRGLNQKSVVFC